MTALHSWESFLTSSRVPGAYDWRFVRAVIGLIKAKKVDLIHSHLDDTNFYACVAGTLCRTPVVATYHGMIGTWHIKNIKDSIKLAAIKHHAKYVVAVSDFLRSELVKAGSFKPGQIQRIYNGVDFEALKVQNTSWDLRNELGVPAGAILIGTIGNMEIWKGFDYFVKAAPIIIEKAPDSYFLIVGEGKGKMLRDIKALIASLNLESRVILTGFREDIPRILSQLDIFVLPSISEGLSIATIEAMAQGKPVVVTDSGGPTEIVENGKTGFVVPPKNQSAIAERVLQLIGNREFACSIGKEAQIAVRSKFDLESNINSYIDLYRHCLR